MPHSCLRTETLLPPFPAVACNVRPACRAAVLAWAAGTRRRRRPVPDADLTAHPPGPARGLPAGTLSAGPRGRPPPPCVLTPTGELWPPFSFYKDSNPILVSPTGLGLNLITLQCTLPSMP